MTNFLKHFASMIPSPYVWQHPHGYKDLLPSLMSSNKLLSIRTISCLQTSVLNTKTSTESSSLGLNQQSGATMGTFEQFDQLGVFKKPEDVGIVAEFLNPSFLIKKLTGGYCLVTSFSKVA